MALQVPYAMRAIRLRLILMVIGSVAPLFALLIAGALDTQHKALDAASREVADYARLTAARQSRIFDEASRLLLTLRALGVISVVGGPDCSETLARIAEGNRRFLTLGVVRADGMIVCHSVLTRPQPFGDAEVLRDALAAAPDDLVVGRMILGRVSGKPTVVAARPLTDGAGATAGMVFASIDLSGFSEFAGRFSESVGKMMMVVDAKQGTVVAGAGAAVPFIGKTFADHPLMAAIRAAPGGGTTAVRGLGGSTEIVAFEPLHMSRLARFVTVIGADRGLMLADARRRAQIDLGLAIGAAVLAVLIVSGLGYWTLVLPLSRLTEAARRIERGDMSARTRMEAFQPAEMLTLSATMNRMAERIDVTNSQLAAQAYEDGLTKLANRRRFDEVLATEASRAERSGRPLSLLLLDVDHFKSFNDLYGHLAGDECLKRMSVALKECAKRGPDLAARYGGEEFALILPDTPEDGARTIARNVLAAIAALSIPHAGAKSGFASVSVGGISTLPDQRRGVAPDELIRLADEALYAAKAAGRATQCCRSYPAAPRLVAVARPRVV